MGDQLRGSTLAITLLVVILPTISCGSGEPRPGEIFENLSGTKMLMFRDRETVDIYGNGLLLEARYTVPDANTLRLVLDEAHMVDLYRITREGLIQLDATGVDEVDVLYLADELDEQRCLSLARAVKEIVADETADLPSEAVYTEPSDRNTELTSRSPGLRKYGDGLDGELRRIADPRARPSRGFIVRLDREGCDESALYRHGSDDVELVARDEAEEQWSRWRVEVDEAVADEQKLLEELLPVFRSWHDRDSAHLGRFRLVEIDDAYVEDKLGDDGGHRLRLRVKEESFDRWPRTHLSDVFVVIRDGQVVDASTELLIAES